MKKSFLFLVLMFTYAIAQATDPKDTIPNTRFAEGFLRITEWNRPLWADVNANMIRLDLGMATNKAEYDWNDRGGAHRPYFWGNLGVDLQLWSGDFDNGRFGVSITTPCSFAVWQDVFGRGTFAVINTDYRIGFADLCFIHRIKKGGFIKNYTIRFSPFMHESTHIGDELAIKRKDDELPITRIDVNYSKTELILGINDPDGTDRMNHHFKIGGLMAVNQEKGWYAFRYAEADKDKVEKVKSPYDFYFQYQFQTNTSKHGFQGILSLEVRNRSVYKYPYYDKNSEGEWVETLSPKEREWCFNGFLGVRYSYHKGIFSKVGLGLKGYYGLNPYGQYRNTPEYTQVGFSLIFE